MSLPKDSGNRGKDRERGARPKVRQSRSEERRDAGGCRKGGKGKKKGVSSREAAGERPVSDGCEYGELLRDLEARDHGAAASSSSSSSPLRESCSLLGQERPTAKPAVSAAGGSAGDLSAPGDGDGRGSSSSRTLRQKIQDAMGQCFPIKTHSVAPPQALSSSSSSSSSAAAACASSRRKIHLSELMLDDCPFPVGSDLAQKWYLIKQHTAPVTQPPLLDSPPPPTSGTAALEDVDDRLRERRRISIEQGVEPPPDAEIHTFEVTTQINPLHKRGPKLPPGMNEPAGPDRTPAQQQQQQQQQQLLQRQQQHELLLQTCLDTLDEVAASASASVRDPSGATDADPPGTTSPPPPPPRIRDGYRVHTQIDYIHCLVPDLLRITNLPCYWGVMDRYEAETLLEGKPEGTFLLRDSAQEDYLFSVSFRRYGRSLHARIEQWNHNFSFDVHDPSVFHAPTVTGLLEHYKDPSSCMFFEPLLSSPVHRTRPFSLQHICRAVVSSRTTYDGINALPIPNALKKHLKEYHYKQRVRVRRMDTWWE